MSCTIQVRNTKQSHITLQLGHQRSGNEARLARLAKQNLEAVRALELNRARTTAAKKLHFHFCFQFPVSVSSFRSISVSCFLGFCTPQQGLNAAAGHNLWKFSPLNGFNYHQLASAQALGRHCSLVSTGSINHQKQ